MSPCPCGLQPFDTDAVVATLKSVRDLVMPSVQGQTLDMVDADDFWALLHLLLTHLT